MPTRTHLAPLLLAGLLGACGSLPIEWPYRNSCTSSYQRPDWTRLKAELEQAQARWTAADLHTYAYTRTVSNFAGEFVTRVDVENGVVARVRDEQTGALLGTDQAFTIDHLFAQLRTAVTQAQANAQSCLLLNVTFDASLGFPTLIDTADLTEGLQDAFGTQRLSGLDPRAP
ncbi:DUF6174 domain-containing protein [Deinococcus planocerae]|uniref:DUF6174 domain-containing protein n=1 Tax=Deinococcus planocerae TaxID=1737569 RepID=UPI000C7EF867|nr:DUF6174 domain-containing protein [Deinococcus planocerae]